MGNSLREVELRVGIHALFIFLGLLLLVIFPSSGVKGLVLVAIFCWALAYYITIVKAFSSLENPKVALRHYNEWCLKQNRPVSTQTQEWVQGTFESRPIWQFFDADMGAYFCIFRDTGDIVPARYISKK